MKKLVGLFALLLTVYAGKSEAQQCGCDPATRPTCRSGAEPECDGNGNWQCPVVVCDPTGPQVCAGECGTWDSELCECYNIPPFCRGEQCEEHHRWECEWDGGRWNDDWCYCEYIYEDGLTRKLPERKLGLRSKRLGHFAPIANSCEEAKIPTSLEWSIGDLRNHNGDPITVVDPSGRTPPRQLASMAWGISRPLVFWVMDQNGASLESGDMEAIERLELQDANPWPNEFISTVRVPVGDNGIFFDCYAFFGRSIIFRPQIGHYLQVKQRIYIKKGRDEYHVRTNCIRMEHDQINARECN